LKKKVAHPVQKVRRLLQVDRMAGVGYQAQGGAGHDGGHALIEGRELLIPRPGNE